MRPGEAYIRLGFGLLPVGGIMNKMSSFAAAFIALGLAVSPASAAPDGKNRKVTVENASSQSIYNLYASPITSTTWEEDLLGAGTIPAGTSKVANIDNGTVECQYDLKVVMADRKEYVQRRVNVCAVNKWVIGDSGDSVQ